MRKFYTIIYNFFILIKVLCPIISFLYTFLWVISFLNAPFYKVLALPFEPFAQFINMIYPMNINYENRLINMSYIICSGLFIIFHYLFDFLAQRMIDLYNFEERHIENKKIKEIKKINKTLEKEFAKEMEKYSNFTILFNIILKSTYNSENNRKEEFNNLKDEFYKNIIKTVKSKYQNSKGIISDKMFLLCNDFNNFDTFMFDFINSIKAFKQKNIENEIETDFLISIDAIKFGANIYNAMEFLENIETFNYKNKIIATSAFKVRYEKMDLRKFKIITLGVSRFFREPDDYTDYELYQLKTKP